MNTFDTSAVWSTLQSSEHQNDQTQEQFLSPSNPSHEHLTLNVEHTTLIYNYLLTTHTYNIYLFIFIFICIIIIIFFISNLHMSDLYTHDCLYCIVFLLFCTLPICILFFCCLCPVLFLSFCCTVELCHYNKFFVCVNIPGQ